MDFFKVARRLGVTLAAGVCAVVSASAGEHRGQVLFGGLPVPGATVTATLGDKKLLAVSDGKGIYSFPDIADGTWQVQVEMLCFEPIKREVVVAPNAPDAVWEMKLLPFAEIQKAAGPPAPKPLTITTAPVPAPATETASAAVPPKKPAKGKKAQPATPTNTANGFQRADLNASADANRVGNETPEANQNAADGLLVNGSVNNSASSAFAQSPAFGNNRKGTRSLYQGSVGITLDNAALDARSFSLTGQDTPKPDFNHMQGFASFGGPLRIPHLIPASRNPINFFIGYQWLRNRNANTIPGLMPTALERSGDLSQSVNPLGLPLNFIDPQTGAPFPGNVIPSTRISPQAKALLNLYPQPTFTSSARYNYEVPVVGTNDSDGVQGVLNKTFSMKNQMNGSFGFQRTAGDTPNLFGFVDHSATSGFQTTVGFSHRFTTHLFARLGFQYSRYSSRSTPFFANKQNVSGEAGITGNNQEPQNWGPPALSFSSGIAGLTDGNQSFDRNQTAAYSYSSFWNHRSHNVSFGGDLKRLQFNALSQQNPRGRFGFTGSASGSDFADFLLGVPSTESIAFGNADKYFRSGSYDLFANDDWRVNSALTINAGARWEYSSPSYEKYGRLVNLDIARSYSAVAPVVASNPTGPLTGRTYDDSLLAPDKGALQPRIGLAWRPFPASSLIIRAGYGVYYNTSVYQTIAAQMAQQSPLSKSLSIQNTKASPLTLATGFNATPVSTPNTFAVDPHFRVGYAQNWNVVVQRDLPFALVMTATYLGIKGTREQQEFLPNTFPIGAINPCPTCPSGYIYLTSNGNSTRESGQLQLRRRLHNGLTAALTYAFSKSIDDAALGGKGQGTAVIAQDWLNLSGERGLSAFDQRHLLTFQGQYTTGMGAKGGTLLSGWKGRLYKEWTLTTNITAGSGLPQSPIYVAPVQGTGVTGTIRPEYTGAPLYSAPGGFYLNPAAYIAPLPGMWGNAARNSIIGPSQFSLGASMSRTFRLSDRFSSDVRLEAANAINHVNYTSWNTNINSAQFGLPTAANAMRRVQLHVRVRF